MDHPKSKEYPWKQVVMVRSEKKKTCKNEQCRRFHNDPSGFIIDQWPPGSGGMTAIRRYNFQYQGKYQDSNSDPHINKKIKII
jgi:hypothetical protein